MNILSFDIEEWYIEKFFKGDRFEKYKEYDLTLGKILDLLEKHSVKATFFCLGSLAEYFPYVIKRITERGHELGCHSNCHKWLIKMSYEELREDTKTAIDMLEQCSGQKVKSYRAPAFSIGSDNNWAFEILAECGIRNDASVFPGTRDFGGFASFSGGSYPCVIKYRGIEINEFPISLAELPIVHKRIAYSGGGYFRLMPFSLVNKLMHNSDYVMCYFHILDLLDTKSKLMTRDEYEKYFKENGSLKNRALRYVKSNLGRKRTFSGIDQLLSKFEFLTVQNTASQLKDIPVIKLD